MTPMNESPLKADKLGRLRYTPEQKKTMVQAYRASGLSAPRFAAHHGVNYQTLVSWIKKDKNSSAPPASDGAPTRFFSLIPALIENSESPPAHQAIEIILPGAVRLSIHSTTQLALAVMFIHELQHSRPC